MAPGQHSVAAGEARLKELDGLRALAILAVAGWHCGTPWAPGGVIGVDIFFVLSGWLITGILRREIERSGQINVARFIWRRVRRLYPALAVLLVAAAYLHFSKLTEVIFASVFMTDILRPLMPYDASLTHTWSLSVEWQFYLLWPLVLLLLLRLGRKHAATALIIAWVAVTAAREGWRLAGLPWVDVYFTPVHSTGLLLGSALALAEWRPKTILIGWLGLAILLLLIGTVSIADHWPPYALAEIAAALVIASPPRLLAIPPLPQIGLISYSLYLWHPIVIDLFIRYHLPTSLLPTLAVGIVIATTSYWLIERPFRGGRNRLDGLRRAIVPSPVTEPESP